MKFYFIDYSRNPASIWPRHTFPPLDIGYCISILKLKGHSCSFLDLRLRPQTVSEIISLIKKERPDFLFIKPGAFAKELTLEITAGLNKFIPHILLFGQFVSLFPEYFLFHGSPLSACVIGELEAGINDVINIRVDENAQPHEWLLKPGHDINKGNLIPNYVKDLNLLPFPEHATLFKKGYTFYYPVNMKEKMRPAFMLSSRGCPNECLFCSGLTRASFGKIYRARSAENVVGEMAEISSSGFNIIYFTDDNFAFDKERTKLICAMIIKTGLHKKLKWAAQCTVKSLDHELIKLMKEAGCSTLCIGIESGNDRILKSLNKGTTVHMASETMRLIKQSGIWTVGFFIIGSPGETRKEMLDSLRFCRKIIPDMLQLHMFSARADAPFFKRCLNDSQTAGSLPKRYNFSGVSDEELKRMYIYFYLRYYFSPAFLSRFMAKQFRFHIANPRESIILLMKSVVFLLRGAKKNEHAFFPEADAVSRNNGFDLKT